MPTVLSEEEKQKKEQIILENAKEMFDTSDFSTITMNALAKRCNMAKGTLFNYFPTKETLFAIILYKEYSEWRIRELEEIEKHDSFTKENYKEFVLDQTKYLLKYQKRLIRLASMKRAIINKNIAPEVLAEQIEGLDKTIHQLSLITEQKIDFLKEEEIYNLYMARHVIMTGAYNLATSPHNIENLAEINKNDLAVIETDATVLKMTGEYLNFYCCQTAENAMG
ncbi:TetR/AcrR family transcriptional regulator [Anaerocolumna xylanovorans]|uniref:Transcriptional regulator, TetR family n=1 Tax=Anaerocolumna xylanovorans DSM 12503 TaxID=1121345 RepID=A0A1M7XZN3_9FIRM|nr:TetR/AcrR family transcriptional regulator [Anaerocolumna xylanovorans]SHO44681.1 transcriptional regulator, TetR family [Anaerocolumna xylanovorans DSM 12503]